MMKFTTIADARRQTGLSYLGGVNISAKLAKNGKISHQFTYCIYLSPEKTSGYNVCSHSTPECRLGCLNTSGRAGMEIITGSTKIQDCRIKKTRLFFEETEFLMKWMLAEIEIYKRKAEKKDYGFSIRLNCTSDIDWSKIKLFGLNIFEIYPEINFYDYTKNFNKFKNKPANYHLTFSYTGRNWNICENLLKQGYNIAMIFNVKNENELPKTFMSYPVKNGDKTDYRINDSKGIIIGLKWKHIGNKIAEKQVLNSCLVVQPNSNECTYTNVHKLANA